MELGRVVVVEDDVEAERVFNDGDGVFGCEGGQGTVVQDKDSDCLATVDLVVEFRLGEVVVEV